MTTKFLLVLAGLALLANPVTAGNKNRGGGGQTKLTPAETSSLLFLREEEKLARDVYLNLFDQWGAAVFSTIAESEQSHMDAIKRLLDKYGLADPVGQIGEFNNLELQDLYDQLVATGSASLMDGLLVGGLIEEVDIEDLQAAMEETTKIDLDQVYGNLMAGSENHLQAFARNLGNITGLPYEAQYLTQAEVDAILGIEPAAAAMAEPAMQLAPKVEPLLDVVIRVAPETMIPNAPGDRMTPMPGSPGHPSSLLHPQLKAGPPGSACL